MRLLNADVRQVDGTDFLQALVQNDDGNMVVVVVKLDGKGAVSGREVPLEPTDNWLTKADKGARELFKAAKKS